ncbi:hypothetical protein ACS5NO_32215 [Larkinella sp. GY13]|uniref:hypothetical protein n=1 Tax=Larkinella sp. GY13 TaxID=3453720 RepID=UPI003EED0574
MNPDDKHPDYNDYISVWQKCRDASAGQRAIKKGGKLYLRQLAGQETKLANGETISAYDAYLDRANYFNATGRTVEAMLGMVFRKPITKKVPTTIDPWLEDIPLSDESLTEFAQTLVK